MFGWFRKDKGTAPGAEKLPGPKYMPDDVGRALVVDLKQDPNWVWSLKAVVKPGERKGFFTVRVFDERVAASRGVRVKDFHSLNDHPELVIFDGWFNKKTHEAEIKSYLKAKAA
jgi:hypothetical protein